MMRIKLFLLFLLVLITGKTWSQSSISGIIKDSSGEPLVGASVLVKNTTNSIMTDVSGKYVLSNVSENDVLVFTYIGMVTQEIKVGNKKVVNVTLKEDSETLDEVVVVGYGVQKKKLVTGATVQVKGDDLVKLNSVSPMSALQSQTPGVNIVKTSGMPGEGYKVSIRGIGTIGDSSPLYVVDGMTVDNIDNINPSDIQSIDVLKDAASAAIYGARAANGVILVTTKKGEQGKVSVRYEGYYGIQKIVNNVTPLNAQQYVEIIQEAQRNSGRPELDFASMVPNWASIENGTWKGTNWFKEATNDNAPTQNHSLSIQGGTKASVYSLGLAYTSQEGIFGKPANPKMDRYNVRVNTEHTLLKNNNYDVVKVGENITMSLINRNTIGVGDKFGNDIRPTLSACPLFPVFDENGDYTYGVTAVKFINPIGMIYYNKKNNLNKKYNLNGNFYVTIQPVKNLVFRSSFGINYVSTSSRSYVPVYELSEDKYQTQDIVRQNISSGYKWIFENTLSYKFSVKNHTFDLLAGTSAEKNGLGERLNVSNTNSLFDDFKHAYIDNANTVGSNTVISGSPFTANRLLSIFGRCNYDYKGTYLATLVLRADGSSNFASNKRWGYFPSVSAGWVMSNEAFMKETSSWLDFLKLRASWGQNGNQSVNPFQYLSIISFDKYYPFGENSTEYTQGAYPSILPNKDITWETSEQISIGFDARVLRNRLAITFDWYNKETKDWLVKAPVMAIMGAEAPYINGGRIRNRGWELGLSWRDHIQSFSYGVNVNLSHNANKVMAINNAEGLIKGSENVLSHNTDWFYGAKVGLPLGYFWGYKTQGVFQNQAQIDNYVNSKGEKIMPDAQPGDLIFVNQNDDAVINESDKTVLGNPNPDYNLGLGLNMEYSGFDLSVNCNGVFGNQIAQAYRSFSQEPFQNYTTEILGRWHGEGTSNSIPRVTTNNPINERYISDRYIQNGDYLRISNLTLGYDFKKLWKSSPFNKMRVYVSVQNLYTFTGYKGLDPEVGYTGDSSKGNVNWAGGIDVGFYPMPRTYLFGVSLTY